MHRWLYQVRPHIRIILKNQQLPQTPMKKTRYSDRGLRIYCFLLIQMIVADFLTLMLSTKDAYKKCPGPPWRTNLTRMPSGRTDSPKRKLKGPRPSTTRQETL